MRRVKQLSRPDMTTSAVYLFEGGMVREHRTPRLQLTHKIRLGSLFTSRILVHGANIFEESSMFDAIKADSELLERGIIVPVLRGKSDSLESYGGGWREKFERHDPAEPAFYQSRRITRQDISAIEKRIEFFSDVKYSTLKMQPVDRKIFQEYFLAGVDRILDDEPDLDPAIKDAIVERASASSSPLGRIRQEVLRPYWQKRGTSQIVRRVARRINVAFFGCGASELDSWLSMNASAFEDLRAIPLNRESPVSELVELSVSHALGISEARLVSIPPDRFASIASSAAASGFRAKVERAITDLGRDLTGDVDVCDAAEARKVLQRQIDDDCRDTFSGPFAREIQKQREIEEHRISRGIEGTLIGLGLATDAFTGYTKAPIGTGTSIGIGLSQISQRVVKPRVAPIIMLQEKLRRAADKAAKGQ